MKFTAEIQIHHEINEDVQEYSGFIFRPKSIVRRYILNLLKILKNIEIKFHMNITLLFNYHPSEKMNMI